MNRNFDYENNNIAYDDQYTKADGGGIKCKNYIICETVLPKWWFECKGSYLCTNCDMMFGTGESVEHKNIGKGNLECPICLELKECVSQPRCNHSLCISCFKRCYYGEYKGEPIFPYPDIEDEYYEDIENVKWENYTLIKQYNEEWDKWNDEKDKQYEREEYLRKCPLCRK